MLGPQDLQNLLRYIEVLALSTQQGANELAKIRCLLEELTDIRVTVDESGGVRLVEKDD